MNAEILAVGTELLLGNIVNTNAQYIAKRLADIGIDVYFQSVVGDNSGRLYKAFELALQRADIVITTGGLGPTQDDLTKEIAAEISGKKLLLDDKALRMIEEYFSRMGRTMTENNKKQAYIPEASKVFYNYRGTAPGCAIEMGGKIIILLPGPPREMEEMFERSVIPYLSQFQEGVLASKILRVCGVGESKVEELLADLLDSQTNPTIALYAKFGEVSIRITAKAETEEKAKDLICPVENEIRKILGNHIYGEGDQNLEDVFGELLIKHKKSIAVAESCTGGLLAGRLINYPGISAVFKEGVVAYSNEAKIRRLGVSEATLSQYGAVSKETALEMAKGICIKAGTSIGISTTGIAGPGGGSIEKPVGLVYAGLCIDGELYSVKFNFTGKRQEIRERTVISVLDWARKILIEKLNSGKF
ncbi:MAG TPA: competence/damage-inducible protein A [Defluviitaleaceae bacterium]|jgi:nicotinamide-nucleotide amidase|nr:competence/damage-inducible protein A [Candidatus Epulonipiscium sp.]HOQ17624.1 competence/damage-inducible protein A [Defluviitaleaceae bacterium]HPT76917.1 competence/damage-inducible protein A [Defluviitaleaceae bacterium]HQD50389.1 competence/damage-inducible protein A [Defluviitaleaceae bacterium]